MRPLSLPAAGSITALIRVVLPESNAALTARLTSSGAVAFTPTLVRRTPGPRTFILGHVTNPDLLMELLADCDAEEP